MLSRITLDFATFKSLRCKRKELVGSGCSCSCFGLEHWKDSSSDFVPTKQQLL
jgi:hypothetical protein